MSWERICQNCSFCQAKTGLLRTRSVCVAPDGRRGEVHASDAACPAFRMTPKAGFGLRGRWGEGVSRSREASHADEPAARAATHLSPAGGAAKLGGSSKRGAPMLQLACDVHTHTLYSRHAYSTIEENVRAAAELHLELLGSTDHYSSMLFSEVGSMERAQGYDLRDFQYFMNYGAWPRVWRGVRLLHGCEADVVDLDGHLFGHDVPLTHEINGNPLHRQLTLKERVFQGCDYVIASVHCDEFARGASLAQTTRMYVRALEDPKVLILGHAGRAGVPFDVGEVLAVAREKGKLVEINEATLASHPSATSTCRRLAERCAEEGVMISTGTDSHISCGIGHFDHVRSMLEEIGFPRKLVATRDAETFLGVLERAVGTSVEE
ncbi:phosphatase [Olsenella phocaeensis]|uniref:phosphatase n=1 Tax=Olsenella phocaeensis TaxID=1852385 RepID=UPI003A8D854F